MEHKAKEVGHAAAVPFGFQKGVREMKSRFEALEVSLELVRSLRRPVESIRRRHPELFRQLRDAATSVTLNLAEGRRRRGNDRTHLWRVAAGSADDVYAALRLALAWGHLSESSVQQSLALVDRLQAMIWPLTK